jgi:fructokinase
MISNVSTNPKYDFLALGEALVDLISTELVASIKDAHHFRRFNGGQASNLAMNMARLGMSSAIVACIGDDGLGQYIHEQFKYAGVKTDLLQITRDTPTTLAIVSRQTRTPDFIIYRGADAFIHSSVDIHNAIRNCKIVHTSAFALSREPGRTTILSALRTAKENAIPVTFDPNFHPNIWPDTTAFSDVLSQAFEYVDITKPSIEDCKRLLGEKTKADECSNYFIKLGAKTVLLSMGADGVILTTKEGEKHHIHSSKSVPVIDVTGAGDAFWAGFIYGLLLKKPYLECARIGQALAEIKINTLGPIKHFPGREQIIQNAQEIQYTPL